MNRIANIETVLGQQLAFLSLQGHEKLSDSYDYQVTVVAERLPIQPESLLGTVASIALENNHQSRYFNGVITKVELVNEKFHQEKKHYIYKLTLRPELWYLTQVNNSRIFQEKSALDIVKEVLAEHHIKFEDKTLESYRTWVYCVQYEETDFDFISRLMEHEGIYYWFKHTADDHTLVLTDHKNSHPTLAVNAQAQFVEENGVATPTEQHIFEWNSVEELTPSSYSTQDYNFENPRDDMRGMVTKAEQHTFGVDLEIYEPFGGYASYAESKHYAQVHLEALQALQHHAIAKTRLRDLAPGYTFTLKGFPIAAENSKYLVIQATYDIRVQSYVTDEQTSWVEINTLQIPATVQYRAPRVHKEPKMSGPQTAQVVGPEGEEIYTDKYGRIKIQFHWDREGKKNEESSCWVRVSTPWAGDGFGGVQIPRIGEEVVVDFVDGQPDRPVVIGRVYNDLNMPPVNLPDEATKSGFFTKSRYGDTSQSNHLMFEDRPGQEMLSLQAEKDLNTQVKNNQTQKIVGNTVSAISGFRSHTAHSTSDTELASGRENTYASDHQRSVQTQLTEEIGGNLEENYLDGVDETITGSLTSSVAGVATHTVKGLHINTDASDDEEVTGTVNETIGGQEVSQIQTGASLKTGDIDFKAQTYDVVSDQSETTVDTTDYSIKPAAGAYFDAKDKIEHKAPTLLTMSLLDTTVSASSDKTVNVGISLAALKDSMAADVLSKNVCSIGVHANSTNAQLTTMGATGLNFQMLGAEDKSGLADLKFTGLSLETGFQQWITGLGKGKNGKGGGKKNNGDGSGDGNPNNQNGNGQGRDPDSKPNECKECQGLARGGGSIGYALGDEQFEHTDFSLGDAIPITWERRYVSNCYKFDTAGVLSPLGPRWLTEYTRYIYRDGNHFVYIDKLGRLVESRDNLALNEVWYDRKEELYWEIVAEGHIEIRYKNHTVEHYEAMTGVYRLTSIRDANGNKIVLAYDKTGQLDTLSSPLYQLQFVYDQDHRIAQISYQGLTPESDTPQTIIVAQYRYDTQGDLVQATDQFGSSNHYQYEQHLITRYTDKTNRGVSLRWDTTGTVPRCIYEVLDDGTMAYSLRYDRENLTTYVTDGLGQTTKYTFNKENYLLGIYYSDGTSRISQRDEFNNITQVKYADGTVANFVYDAFDNLIETINPDGSRIRYTYDADNHLRVLEEPNGSRWLRDYDQFHQVITETDPLGHVTEYGYSTQGYVTRVIDAKGGVKHLMYTPTGQLAAYRDCSGKTTQYRYDAFDRLIEIIEPSGTTEHYTYDAKGQLAKVERSGTNPVYFAHDEEGRLLTFVDGLSHTTSYRYNEAGRVQARIDALNHEVAYRYDPLGRLSQLLNENQDRYTFAYDPQGRLVYEQAFDGKQKHYHVNKQTGRLDGVTFEDQTIRYQYDVMGRVTQVMSADETRAYGYDINGRLIFAENPHARHQFTLDALGNVIAEDHDYTVFDHQVSKHWAFAYDELSNLITTKRPDGRVVDYLRYGSGHLHGMLLDKERLIDVERDSNHREVKRHWANDLMQSTEYDIAGRLSQQHTQTGKYVKQTVLQRVYDYDGANRLTGIKDSRKGELSYQYDPIGRLLQARGPLGEERFSFDPAHNILSKTSQSSSGDTPSSTLPSGVSSVVGNLLKGIAGIHFSYDARGNMTRKEGLKGIQTFQWDAHNQLRQSGWQGGARESLRTEYLYDAFGRRIAKRVESGEHHRVVSQTLYDWEGLSIASEEPLRTANATNLSTTQGVALARDVQYVYEDGSFVPLAQYINSSTGEAEHISPMAWGAESAPREASASPPKLYHYVCDQIGTPQLLLNQSQEVVWEAESKAWGETYVEPREVKEGVVNNHRFQGQYYDEESELHYNTFRYYDPELGRFISQDPIGLMGGINVYQYAPNPVEWVDPWGLAKMGWYQYLKKAKDGLQAHHLNQNAAFKQWIPQERGASIKLKGNAFFDRGSDHYVVHQELEKFWNQYRKGGVKYGENPTVADYNDAMKSALCKTSLSTKEVDKAVDSAMRNQRQFGVNPEMVFGRIPRRIYQR